MKKHAFEIRWGIIFTVASMLWMLLERLVGLHTIYIDEHMVYTNFFAIVAVAIYVFALRAKRDHQLSGIMNFQEGFICGVKITVVVAVLSPLTQWVTHTIITPDYFANAAALAVQTENMTQAQAEAYFSLSSYYMQAFIGAVVMGVITSAVVAFFVKKPPTVEEDTEE
ncbi:MAG: DUF4199 domain-containing protein [Idiomarina sp.]